MHSFKYSDINGNWNFDFRYLNPKATLSPPQSIQNTMTSSGYTNPILNNTALNYYKTVAQTGSDTTKPYPAMDFSSTAFSHYDDEGKPLTVGDVVYSVWEDYTMGIGSWGVTYTTNIRIKNFGNARKLSYTVNLANFMGVRYDIIDNNTGQSIWGSPYTEAMAANLGADDYVPTDVEVFRLNIPAGADYTYKVSVLNGVGTTGFENQIKLLPY